MVITESWSINKQYNKGDIVYIFDITSTTYFICTNSHISKTVFYPSNKQKWLIIKQDFVDEMIQHGMNINSYNYFQPNSNPNITLPNIAIPPQSFKNKTTDDIYEEKNEERNNEKNNEEKSTLKRKLDEIEMEIEKYNITKKNKSTFSKKDQILLLKASVETKSHLLEKYQDMKKETSSDYDKSVKWLNTILKLPFNTKACYDVDLTKIKKTLDEEVYGHEQIKRNILQYFAKKKSNPNSKGEILALHGSPGVGKTKIIRDGLAKAINVPFHQINCGGLNDVAVITGHSSTYVGSKPGKIVDILIESKCNNPIIYIDELDKISDSKKKELYGIFTHIFDEQQNKSFQDNYIGNLDIDLSNIFFIVSFNNISAIDPILLDRFKIIQVPDPTFNDKIEICKKMFNSIKNEIWKNVDVKIDDENGFFEYLLYNYHTNDVGVRQIRKSIYTILENINLDNQLNNKILKTINVQTELIDKYLFQKKESKDYLNMYL